MKEQITHNLAMLSSTVEASRARALQDLAVDAELMKTSLQRLNESRRLLKELDASLSQTGRHFC